MRPRQASERNATRYRRGLSRASAVRLATHVDLLAYARDDFAAARRDRGLAPAQMLVAAGRRCADLVEHRFVDTEFGEHVFAARRDEFDCTGLVPDDVTVAEAAQGQDHPERIGHREQA